MNIELQINSKMAGANDAKTTCLYLIEQVNQSGKILSDDSVNELVENCEKFNRGELPVDQFDKKAMNILTRTIGTVQIL